MDNQLELNAKRDAIGHKRKTLVLLEPYWEKQRLETVKQFDAWVLYRDMEDKKRSTREVAKLLGKSEALIQRWQAMNKWTVRLSAMKNHDAQIARIARLKAQEDQREIERQLAHGLQLMGGHFVENMLGIRQAREQNPELEYPISARDAIHAIDAGIKWMRTIDNLPTEHITIETPEMAKERQLREAVADITEMYRLEPHISLEERIAWAAVDYEIDEAVLQGAVHGHLEASEAIN